MQTSKTSFEELIARADDAVTTYSVAEAQIRLQQEGVLLVDIRDIRELEREGRIVGARHVPRGMLEFWMHPDSPYYRDYLGQASEVILYCNRGWRSALAASQMKDLGLTVSHMDGGFSEWKEKNLPIETFQR
jgi:rhodanese-related sulfurtransferase